MPDRELSKQLWVESLNQTPSNITEPEVVRMGTYAFCLSLQPVVAMGEAINFLWGGSSISFLCFLRYLPKASNEITGNSNSEE